MYNDDEVADISPQGMKWKEFFKTVCKIVYEADTDKFNKAYNEGKFKKQKNDTALISKEKISDKKYELIDSIGFYVLCDGLNANSALKYAKQIIEACELNLDKFKVRYENDSSNEQ